MQTPTSRSTNGGRWARCLGIGAMAAASAATVLAIAAPASAAPANAPIGATGSVAALGASSMEVQNPSSGQTTVNWNGTTQFSLTVTESVGSVAVGDCVTATGSASKNSKTTVAARRLTVTSPSSSGTCNGGGARFGGNASNGAPPSAAGGGGFRFRTGGGEGGTRPSFPSGSRANNFRRNLANLDFASGKVSAVKGSTLTVSGISLSGGSFRRPSQASSKSKTKKPTTPKTQTLTVTTSGSTTVSATQSAAASNLAVGDCVSTFGPAATNGSVTATTVRITSSGGESCTGGFAGPGGGGGFFGGPGGGGA